MASAASAAGPSAFAKRHSRAPKPLVPGLALRGRRRAAAGLGITETLLYLQSRGRSVIVLGQALSSSHRAGLGGVSPRGSGQDLPAGSQKWAYASARGAEAAGKAIRIPREPAVAGEQHRALPEK